jgi:hypothetical protein
MGFLDNLFGKPAPLPPKLINIDLSLGNVAIIGGSRASKDALSKGLLGGVEKIIKNYAIDANNNDAAIFIFRNVNLDLCTYPHICPYPNAICEMDNSTNAMTEQFDAFAYCGSESDKNDAILELFESFQSIEQSQKMSYLTYIAIMRNLLIKDGKQVMLNNLNDYSFDVIDSLNQRLPLPQDERDRNSRFLNSFRLHSSNIESYFRVFANNTIGNIMSGNRSLDKIFEGKDIMEVSFDFFLF